MPNPSYYIQLIIRINPNPLCGNLGKHVISFNNNNGWVAYIKPVDIEVENPSSAQIDLIVNGSPSMKRMQVPVGNIASWQSSHPITTDVQPRSNATSSGETVKVSCSVSRAPVSPTQPPPPAYPLDDITLVRLF